MGRIPSGPAADGGDLVSGGGSGGAITCPGQTSKALVGGVDAEALVTATGGEPQGWAAGGLPYGVGGPSVRQYPVQEIITVSYAGIGIRSWSDGGLIA